MSKKTNDLSDLKNLVEEQSKDEYQSNWKKNMYQHRKMVAKKNRKWLESNKDKSEFKPYKDFPDVYQKIDELFCDEKKRKISRKFFKPWMKTND
jgi:hypothetical protein